MLTAHWSGKTIYDIDPAALARRGILLLLCYSAGLGIPFLASALLIQSLKTAFDWIKRHYRPIQFFSGGLLIVVGIAMMTGLMGRLLSVLAI